MYPIGYIASSAGSRLRKPTMCVGSSGFQTRCQRAKRAIGRHPYSAVNCKRVLGGRVLDREVELPSSESIGDFAVGEICDERERGLVVAQSDVCNGLAFV